MMSIIQLDQPLSMRGLYECQRLQFMSWRSRKERSKAQVVHGPKELRNTYFRPLAFSTICIEGAVRHDFNHTVAHWKTQNRP
jgi:hypothetical protein